MFRTGSSQAVAPMSSVDFKNSLLTCARREELNALIAKGPSAVVEAAEFVLQHDSLVDDAFDLYQVIRKAEDCENSLKGLYSDAFYPRFTDGKRFAELMNAFDDDDRGCLGYTPEILTNTLSSLAQREMIVLSAIVFSLHAKYKEQFFKASDEFLANIDPKIISAEQDLIAAEPGMKPAFQKRLNELNEQKEQFILKQKDLYFFHKRAINAELNKSGVLLQLAIKLNEVSKRQYGRSCASERQKIKKRKIYLEILNSIATSDFRCDETEINALGYNPASYFGDQLLDTFNQRVSLDRRCLIMFALNQVRTKYADKQSVEALDDFTDVAESLSLHDIQYALLVRNGKVAEVYKPETKTIHSEEAHVEDAVISAPEKQAPEVKESFLQRHRKLILGICLVLVLAGLGVGMAASFGALGIGAAIIIGCAVGYGIAGISTAGGTLAFFKSKPTPASATLGTTAKLGQTFGSPEKSLGLTNTGVTAPAPVEHQGYDDLWDIPNPLAQPPKYRK